jgi:hypothetical protein
MPGGFGVLMEIQPKLLTTFSTDPYPMALFLDLMRRSRERMRVNRDVIVKFAMMGRSLANNPDLPWARTTAGRRNMSAFSPNPKEISYLFDDFSGLGVAAACAIYTEMTGLRQFGRTEFDYLPMPTPFKKLFRDWGKGRVDFVEFVGE